MRFMNSIMLLWKAQVSDPYVFIDSHYNPLYGKSATCKYYIECPYCNTWVDVRDHCNCPNCTAPLHRNCLNKY